MKASGSQWLLSLDEMVIELGWQGICGGHSRRSREAAEQRAEALKQARCAGSTHRGSAPRQRVRVGGAESEPA